MESLKTRVETYKNRKKYWAEGPAVPVGLVWFLSQKVAMIGAFGRFSFGLPPMPAMDLL